MTEDEYLTIRIPRRVVTRADILRDRLVGASQAQYLPEDLRETLFAHQSDRSKVNRGSVFDMALAAVERILSPPASQTESEQKLDEALDKVAPKKRGKK